MKPVMRKDVPEELTWDLSALYKTEEYMYADAEKMEAASRRIEAEYKGKLTDPERINACLDEYRTLCERMNLVYSYTDLSVSVDYYDAHNQERNDKIGVKVSAIESRLSFIDSEILEQDDSVIQSDSIKTFLMDSQTCDIDILLRKTLNFRHFSLLL